MGFAKTLGQGGGGRGAHGWLCFGASAGGFLLGALCSCVCVGACVYIYVQGCSLKITPCPLPIVPG